ncbi:hypothetical protein [Phenylobacterium sp.]|jgi:hypothetical protein|uniref:hypothetical protein n=1 Tax=Phenylobacterium sp. TaxID=1871053 RepID=UPI002ED9F0B2
MPYLPPAALCAVAAALALAACQGKAPAAQADAIANPTVALAVSQNNGPAFAAPADPDAAAAVAPPSTLGELTTTKGFNHTFNIVPASAPAPSAPAAGGPTADAGED